MPRKNNNLFLNRWPSDQLEISILKLRLCFTNCTKVGLFTIQGRHGEFEPGKVQYSTTNFFDRLFPIRVHWNTKSMQKPNLDCLACCGGPAILFIVYPPDRKLLNPTVVHWHNEEIWLLMLTYNSLVEDLSGHFLCSTVRLQGPLIIELLHTTYIHYCVWSN